MPKKELKLPQKRTIAADNIAYSKMQKALLTILSGPMAAVRPVTLDDLQRLVYKKAGKKKPENARPAIAGLIRSTSAKISFIGGAIERKSRLGRGNTATYVLTDKKGLVKETLSNA